MDEEFNITDAMIDIMIDQLHKCAELEEEELENHWDSSSAERATAF
tara:strand:- start:1311 stop:1448 length:138 start_codon:yes stop_codon:yes gene_type:complete